MGSEGEGEGERERTLKTSHKKTLSELFDQPQRDQDYKNLYETLPEISSKVVLLFNMLKQIVLIFVAIQLAQAVTFTDCNKSKDGTVTAIAVGGCTSSDKACPIKRGAKMTMTADFTSSKFEKCCSVEID